MKAPAQIKYQGRIYRLADLHDPTPGGPEDAWDNGSDPKSRLKILQQLKIPPYGDRKFSDAEAKALATKRWRELPQNLKDDTRFIRALLQDVRNVYGF